MLHICIANVIHAWCKNLKQKKNLVDKNLQILAWLTVTYKYWKFIPTEEVSCHTLFFKIIDADIYLRFSRLT